jgi:hypothetical protein
MGYEGQHQINKALRATPFFASCLCLYFGHTDRTLDDAFRIEGALTAPAKKISCS